MTKPVYFIFLQFEQDLYAITDDDGWCPSGVWTSLQYACNACKDGGWFAAKFQRTNYRIKLLKFVKYAECPDVNKRNHEQLFLEQGIMTQRDMRAYCRKRTFCPDGVSDFL